jgi:hypothetical protein
MQQRWEMAEELPWGETEESKELGGRSFLSCLGLGGVALLLWFLAAREALYFCS